MLMHWSDGDDAMSKRYWASRQQLLLSRDRQSAMITMSILTATLCYNINVLYQGDGIAQGAHHYVLVPMLGHILLESLAFLLCQHQAYAQYRPRCIIAFRLVTLAMMLHYVPKTWEYTIPAELASGRAVAVAYRLILAGCLSASCTVEVLAFQLPMAASVPYHILRAAICLAQALPQLLQVFAATPSLSLVAKSLWEDLTWLFGSAAASGIGANIPVDNSACPCPVLAVMLFVHVALALLLPLYTLGLYESRTKQAFGKQLRTNRGGAHGADNTLAALADPASDAFGDGSRTDNSGDASNCSYDSNTTSSSPSSGSGGFDDVEPLGVIDVCSCKDGMSLLTHGFLLLCCTMILWAMVDAIVAVWKEQLTAYFGVCI